MHEGTGDFIKLSVVVNHGCWWQTKVDIHVECLSGVSGPGPGAMICTLMTSAAAADTDAFRDGGRAIGSFADMS